jgi:hypothetical protein
VVEDVDSASNVREGDGDVAVKTTGSDKGWVEGLREVGLDLRTKEDEERGMSWSFGGWE